MSTVFLSYRRSDTQGEAGRLADDLQRKFGQRFAFRDVVSVSPGEKFNAKIIAELENAKVVLVLIGPAWLDDLNDRLTKGEIDYLRKEVVTALSKNKRVIPVLLKGALLPPPNALPEDLRELAKCQTITIRDETWRTDVERLIDAIGRPYRWDLLAIRMVIALGVTIIVVWLLAPQFTPERASDYGFFRGLILTSISVYGLIELSLGYRHFRRLKSSR